MSKKFLFIMVAICLLSLVFVAACTPIPNSITPAKAIRPTPTSKLTRLATEPPTATKGFKRYDYAASQYYLHIPPNLKANKPLQIVMVIHGMGGNGDYFGQPLLEYADRYGFVLVAPNMRYEPNYQDPDLIAANDAVLLPELYQLLDDLEVKLNYPAEPKVLLFGFSRGAQIVHRFATFYPKRVAGVAVISAGTYTLPATEFKATHIRFPFGTSDLADYTGQPFDLTGLQGVKFWLAVGETDVNTQDVPQAWTSYLGQTRVERAQHYYEALQKAGVEAKLTIFPEVDHTICEEMKQAAFEFFKKVVG